MNKKLRSVMVILLLAALFTWCAAEVYGQEAPPPIIDSNTPAAPPASPPPAAETASPPPAPPADSAPPPVPNTDSSVVEQVTVTPPAPESKSRCACTASLKSCGRGQRGTGETSVSGDGCIARTCYRSCRTIIPDNFQDGDYLLGPGGDNQFADCGGSDCGGTDCPCLPEGSELRIINGKVIGIIIGGKVYSLDESGQASVDSVTYKINTDATHRRRYLGLRTNIPTDGGSGAADAPQGESGEAQEKPVVYSSEPVMLEIEGEKLFGVRYTIKEEGKDKKYFNSGDEWYYYDEGSKTWKACDETNCGQDPQGKINKAIAQQCGYDTNADQQSAEVQACMERLAEDQYSQTGFANMIMEEREFTFQEGLQLGSTLWGLGVKFKLWSEADNPMAQLNDYFANTKTGMLLTGEWEKLICWETTDFNNPNDGIAFVPGTENVGAWIAGEYVKYTHPLISDPNRKVTEYIYRITSSVDPSGLTENSGSANCMDFLEFQYTMDNKVVDLDMDGMTSDDTVRLACDSGGFSMTGANALVRNSTKLYSMACIKFSPSFLKQGFSENLNGGMLCAPIVPSGYEYTTRCDFCVPFLAGTGLGPASGGIGFGSSMPTSYGAAVAENRPGVVNPSSMG